MLLLRTKPNKSDTVPNYYNLLNSGNQNVTWNFRVSLVCTFTKIISRIVFCSLKVNGWDSSDLNGSKTVRETYSSSLCRSFQSSHCKSPFFWQPKENRTLISLEIVIVLFQHTHTHRNSIGGTPAFWGCAKSCQDSNEVILKWRITVGPFTNGKKLEKELSQELKRV